MVRKHGFAELEKAKLAPRLSILIKWLARCCGSWRRMAARNFSVFLSQT